MLWPSRNAATENSTGIVGTSVGSAFCLEHLAAVGEHVVDDRRLADPLQVVVADHPLVVLDDRAAGADEALVGGLRGELVDDPVVEAHHREVRLRDRQVLVVARVGDDRELLARAARQVEALLVGELAVVRRLAHLELAPVVVEELLRLRVVGAGAVERVEVERRRAALAQLRRGDVGAERDLRLVEGQVVVDELPEVRVAGRDGAVRPRAARGHRLREPSCGSAGRAAGRPSGPCG